MAKVFFYIGYGDYIFLGWFSIFIIIKVCEKCCSKAKAVSNVFNVFCFLKLYRVVNGELMLRK